MQLKAMLHDVLIEFSPTHWKQKPWPGKCKSKARDVHAYRAGFNPESGVRGGNFVYPLGDVIVCLR